MAVPTRLQYDLLIGTKMDEKRGRKGTYQAESEFCSFICRKNDQESLQLNKSDFSPQLLFYLQIQQILKLSPTPPLLLHLVGGGKLTR